MTVVVEPLDATLGAVVTGVSLAGLTDDQWATIADALVEHALLVFPAQHLDDDQQRAFGERFGELEVVPSH